MSFMDTPSPSSAPETSKEKWNRWGDKTKKVILVLVVLLVAMIYFGQKIIMGTKYKVSDKESVNYSEKATEDDAKKLGEILKADGYFSGEREMDVLLKKDDKEGTVISFVLSNKWSDPEIVKVFNTIGEDIAAKGFGKPLIIRMLDEHLNTKNDLTVK